MVSNLNKIPGWKQVQYDPSMGTKLVLPLQEAVELEMATIKAGKYITFEYRFLGENEEYDLKLELYCDDVKSNKWHYSIQNCTRGYSFYLAKYSLIMPADEVRLWSITKTPTHMRIG